MVKLLDTGRQKRRAGGVVRQRLSGHEHVVKRHSVCLGQTHQRTDCVHQSRPETRFRRCLEHGAEVWIAQGLGNELALVGQAIGFDFRQLFLDRRVSHQNALVAFQERPVLGGQRSLVR